MSTTSRQFRLAARPVGLPTASDWEYREEPLGDPGDGRLPDLGLAFRSRAPVRRTPRQPPQSLRFDPLLVTNLTDLERNDGAQA
jgi:hypothetical protein